MVILWKLLIIDIFNRFVLNENIHSFSENNKNSSKVLIYMEIEWINSLQEIKNDNNGNFTLFSLYFINKNYILRKFNEKPHYF